MDWALQALHLEELERVLRTLKVAKKYKHHELRIFLYYSLWAVFDGILGNDNLENLLLLQYAILRLGGF